MECPLDERISGHVAGPRFAERARKREQHGTPCERDHIVFAPYGMAACIHDECPRLQHCFNPVKQKELFLAMRNQARRMRVQDQACASHLRHQCRDACLMRGALGPGERSARGLGPNASRCDPRNDQFVGGPRRRRERRRIERGKRTLGLVETPDQEKTPDLEMPRMRGVHRVAVFFECRARRVERLGRPAEVARHERDLCLSDDTPRAGHGLPGTEGARRALQESLGADEIAELRHRDAAKREGRGVTTQANPLQYAKEVTRSESPRRSRDQRIHPNPVTLVTPAVRRPAPDCLTNSEGSAANGIAFQTEHTRDRSISEVAMATSTSPDKGRKEGQNAMNAPKIVSPQEWEAAREQLLVKEKVQIRARDALAAERRRMPWMAVEKRYEFDGPKGSASLLDLFEGRHQLIVYRAFFEPGVHGWPEHGCIGCSLGADQVGHLAHLNARDTTLVYASRAPQADIARLKARMGWEIPWYTITDGFDADFGVDEWHGHNAFIRDGERVFRTYFINSRGDEAMGTIWSYLDMTALGRQEAWEDSPEGYPQSRPYKWWNWHDSYVPDAAPDPKWVEVSDAGEAAFRKRDAEAKA
jgi:predicted dithiol-disulfide oxidoreductase (DUF899 family)